MKNYPEPVSKYCTKIIYEQIDTSIYKIKINKNFFRTGFFCFIKYKNKEIPILISSNEIVKEIHNDSIDISIINKNKKLILERIIYEDKKQDLVIIEINENSINDINFLEIDGRLYEEDSEIYYREESIYLIHYNKDYKNISVSYGIINKMEHLGIIYSCNKKSNIKNTPIFSLSNNKLIGIHNCSSTYYNKGISFKEIIDIFNQKYSRPSEIHIQINVNNYNYNKKIYFLGNFEKDSI